MTVCAWCSPGTGPGCSDYHADKGYICTRLKGHTGDHIACGDTRHSLAAWPPGLNLPDLLAPIESDPT